jgi:hypothetical protein
MGASEAGIAAMLLGSQTKLCTPILRNQFHELIMGGDIGRNEWTIGQDTPSFVSRIRQYVAYETPCDPLT